MVLEALHSLEFLFMSFESSHSFGVVSLVLSLWVEVNGGR